MESKKEHYMISARISKEERDLLYQYAEDSDLTISQIIRKALKVYLTAKTQKKGK